MFWVCDVRILELVSWARAIGILPLADSFCGRVPRSGLLLMSCMEMVPIGNGCVTRRLLEHGSNPNEMYLTKLGVDQCEPQVVCCLLIVFLQV